MTEQNCKPEQQGSFSGALGKLSSGVYVVTVGSGSNKQGMLATWIIQAAFTPPMLCLSIQSQRAILSQLEIGERFSVNTLAKKNKNIFQAFARAQQSAQDRFADLKLAEKSSAGPVFAEALSYLDCIVKTQLAAGDHTILVAEITGGELLKTDDPMLHTRTNGFWY
jgi:flavin reductase (DIM6/NTAB) family NADH-FMN oxidoreductase RutF